MQWKRIIVDGNNLAHVYRHVYDSLYTRKGIPTGVTYGFISLIGRLVDTFNPDEVIIAWDFVGQSARSLFSPVYKSDRRNKIHTKKEEDSLEEFNLVQMPLVKEFLFNLGVPQVSIPLLEGDDVISVCVNHSADTSEWVVVSNDKDFIQWVRLGKCRVYAPMTGNLYFQDKYGAICGGKTEFGMSVPSPETYAIWRAIVGDKSDSIKGLSGVGHTTVYDVFKDSLPATNADDDWKIIKYLRTGHYSSARSKIIEAAAVKNGPEREALMGALFMMRPTTENINHLLDYVKTHSGKNVGPARKFVNTTTNKPKAMVDAPKFLKNIDKDPNPFVVKLRALNFEMAYNSNYWYPVIKGFRHMYMRRKEWGKHTPWSPSQEV